MAEVRCPMCGKPNPAELEVCQHCEARLKPLLGPSAGDTLPGDISNVDESHADADWLDRLRSSNDEQLESDAPEPEMEDRSQPAETFDNGGKPDWLADIRASTDSLAHEPEDDDLDEFDLMGAEGDDEIPEWLRRIRSRKEAEMDMALDVSSGSGPGDPDAVESPKPSEDIPDWLAELQEKTGQTGELATSSDDARSEPPKVPPFTEEIDFGDEDDPDWLANLVNGPAETVAEEDVPVAAGGDQDWRSGSVMPGDQDDIGLGSQEGSESELTFDWLEAQAAGVEPENDLAHDAREDVEKGDQAGSFTDDLPEWMDAEEGVEPGESKPDSAPQAKEDELAPAELPGWLEAMRPVEATATSLPTVDEDSGQVESSGPLAGLRSVLPAEPEIARLLQPKTRPTKLQVSQSQKKHVEVLTALLKAEGEPQPLPSKAVISSQDLLRVAIFLVMIGAVLWALLYGGGGSPIPALPSETFDVISIVNNLPDTGNVPVLVAIDYDPGLSGEMEAAAYAFIDHLMLKGAYLTLISTSTTGPAQAERLIQLVNQRGGHFYAGANQYANLGYIPGGASGLLAFSVAPQQVTPYAVDGSRIWEKAPLQNVRGLDQFALVVVITESAEKARAWVEQVGPRLDQTPFVMVLSAQAEPLVRPFYDANPKQVDGLITGLAGGAVYGSTLARPSQITDYWDAFSIASVVAVALMVLAGLGNMLFGMVSRSKTKGQRGEA